MIHLMIISHHFFLMDSEIIELIHPTTPQKEITRKHVAFPGTPLPRSTALWQSAALCVQPTGISCC